MVAGKILEGNYKGTEGIMDGCLHCRNGCCFCVTLILLSGICGCTTDVVFLECFGSIDSFEQSLAQAVRQRLFSKGLRAMGMQNKVTKAKSPKGNVL